MADKTYRPPATAWSRGGPSEPSTAMLPPDAMACLALSQPDEENVGWLAGEVDNSLLLSCMGEGPQAPQESTPAPAIDTPWSSPLWRYGNLRPGAVGGDPRRDRAPTEADTQAFDTFHAEDAAYDALLNADREALARQAAEDREAGLPSAAVAEDDRMRALWAAHDALANVDDGQGGQVPAGYYIHQGEMISQRAGSGARTTATRELGKQASNRLMTGKGSIDALTQAITTLGGLGPSLWAGLNMNDRVNRISPPGMDEAGQRQAQLLAFFQHAGLGVDCEGYTQDVVLGASPDADVNAKYNATGWGKRAGSRTESGVASPLDADGKLAVRAGDVLNIHPTPDAEIAAAREKQQTERASGTPAEQQTRVPLKHGHIGVVLQVAETDTEVVMRLGHSTPNQDQYNGDTFLGSRPEGPRDDVYVFDKQEGTWHTVRGAFSDADVESQKANHGLPLFSEFRSFDEVQQPGR